MKQMMGQSNIAAKSPIINNPIKIIQEEQP